MSQLYIDTQRPDWTKKVTSEEKKIMWFIYTNLVFFLSLQNGFSPVWAATVERFSLDSLQWFFGFLHFAPRMVVSD